MRIVTATCRHCGEEFEYEPVRRRSVVSGHKEFKKPTVRSVCDKCRKNSRRRNRTVENGYLSRDETKREKEIREAQENIKYYIFKSLHLAQPLPWHPGPGIENPLEFGYDPEDFGEVA